MILEKPPGRLGLGDWYLKSVTGTPFVLLNILNLQRAGVVHLTIFHPDLGADPKLSVLKELSEDRRVANGLEWVHNGEDLEKELKDPNCRWILNGGALHRGASFKKVLDGESDLLMVKEVGPDEIKGLIKEKTQSDLDLPLEELGGTWNWIAGGEAHQVNCRRDFRRQSEILLKESGLSNDSLLDRLITRRISREMTRFFLMTPLTPNQITLLAMVVGLASAICFFNGGYETGVAGAVLLMISTWFDCADGEVARLSFRETPLGGILDIWADNLVHIAVFFSMGMGLYFSTENGIYKILGTFAVVGTLASFAMLQSDIIKSKMQASHEVKETENASLVDRMANRDFIYFLLVMALANQLNIFLALTAIGANVFALWLAFQRYRNLGSLFAGECSKNSEKA